MHEEVVVVFPASVLLNTNEHSDVKGQSRGKKEKEQQEDLAVYLLQHQCSLLSPQHVPSSRRLLLSKQDT